MLDYDAARKAKVESEHLTSLAREQASNFEFQNKKTA
jgi:hypothetical protein